MRRDHPIVCVRSLNLRITDHRALTFNLHPQPCDRNEKVKIKITPCKIIKVMSTDISYQTQNSRTLKIMNVKNNEQCGNSNRSEDTSCVTDAVINKLLAKYNLNKVADSVGLQNFPVNPTTSENNDAFQKEISKEPPEEPVIHKKANIDDIFKRYSKIHGAHEHRNISRDSVYMQNYSTFTNNCENTRNMDADLAFLKRKIAIPNNKNENHRNTNKNREFYYDKAHAEKTTFCRPVCNIYNEEFIYKTLERNAKLQALLKRLILARRKEKEKEEWNNYVNELKNRHIHNSIPRHIVSEYVPQERFFIEPNDIYRINQTQTSKNLINDFVYSNASNEYPLGYTEVDKGSGAGYLSENELHCYPTASQGRAMVLERERKRLASFYHTPAPKKRAYVPRVIYIDMADMTTSQKTRQVSISDDVTDPDTHEYIEAAATQTPKYGHPPSMLSSYAPQIIRIQKEWRPKRRSVSISAHRTSNADVKFIEPTADRATQISIEDLNNKSKTSQNDLRDIGVQISKTNLEPKTTKEEYDEVTKNVNRLKTQIDTNEQKNQEKGCMRKIESKLDSLAKSINHLITKMRKKCSSTNTSVKESKELKINEGREDKDENGRNGTLSVGYVETNTSTTAFQAFPRRLRRFEPTTMIDDIICEELDKSNRLRRELGELLHTQTQQKHSVQIIFDVPTREHATEVTDSLPRTEVSDKEVEEISLDVDRSQMTIAVNTDPLGLLSLLTLSSDVVRQVLSLVPTVDCSWYLSRLPLPGARGNTADFVCNICGACFARPSQLSDHMRNHDFGNTKDCCVCRHVLDLKRRRAGLFACRYCGQRFTRAYCCELHQQSCARALGVRHDVEPSLSLLR